MRAVFPIGTLIVAASFSATTYVVASTKTTSTWAASDVQPGAYKKVLVLAGIKEDSARRILEDTVVTKLKKEGVEAVAAYQVLAPEDLASREAIEAKARRIGVDSGIVFTVTEASTEVKSGPTVHASVGIPVRAGPFSVFLGTSVPLDGGSSTAKKVGVKAEFHAIERSDPRWIGTYTTDLKGGADRVASELATQTVKHIKKAHLLE